MRKILNGFRKIVLLAYLVFVVLCVHSCFMSGQIALSGDAGTGTGLISAFRNDITLSSGAYAEDTENLVAVVQPSDLPLLDSFPALKSVDFSGSSCYADIISWAQKHPDITVRYTVSLPDGQTVENNTESLDLSGMQASNAAQTAQLLRFLPELTSVDLGTGSAGNILSSEDFSAIRSACPNASVSYVLDLLGRTVQLTETELDLTTLQNDQAADAASVLACLNDVRMIHLSSSMDWDAVARIHSAAPNAVLDYSFNLWGVDTNLSAETLNFSHISMNDQGEAVKAVLPYMVNLKTLDMDSCGVDNAHMAAIRSEYPKVDVIWRIWFAGYSVRTDTERILASSVARGGVVNNEEASKLQYCDHVKYVDLGHNEVLSDISFARGMPNLEVLILAINDVSDISPLADCPKLEYLEINSTNVTDLTPLANSSSLRHLNIGRNGSTDASDGRDMNRPRVTDISPLYGLKDLERLWIGALTAPGIPQEQIAHMQECAPNCVINLDAGDPSQGEWRTTGERPDWVWAQWMETGVFNDPLNERYLLLREQMQYDRGDAAYSLPQNDPLY